MKIKQILSTHIKRDNTAINESPGMSLNRLLEPNIQIDLKSTDDKNIELELTLSQAQQLSIQLETTIKKY